MDQMTMDVIDKASGARGRKDAEGVEVVIKEKPLRDAVANLLTLKSRAEGIVRKLSAIESVMVDPHRKSVRDVLRNPGLLQSVDVVIKRGRRVR